MSAFFKGFLMFWPSVCLFAKTLAFFMGILKVKAVPSVGLGGLIWAIA